MGGEGWTGGNGRTRRACCRSCPSGLSCRSCL